MSCLNITAILWGSPILKHYDLNDWMRYFAAEQKAISRDQIYLFAQHPVTELLNLGFTSVVQHFR